MGNILRFALIWIGIIAILFGLYLWLVPDAINSLNFQMKSDKINSQIISLLIFGFLMLIGGLAYKRR